MATSELPFLKGAILRSTVSLQSDDRLVELVREGVDPAFDVIVERYRPALQRYAGRMLDSHRAEDVVQEVFVKAHGSLIQDERPMQLKAWLYRITHNLALDSVRQKHWNYEQLDPNYDGVRQPPDYLDQKEQLRGIIERMGVLPERQRRALILRAFEGRSSEEIAQQLEDGVPEVRQLVHRARVRLRNAFGALIPLPLFLWLRSGTASAAASSHSAGKLVAGAGAKGSLAKVGAALVAASAVAAGGVVLERGVDSAGPTTAAYVEPAAGLSGPDGLPEGRSRSARSGDAVSQGGRRASETPTAVGAAPASAGQARGGSEGGPSTESGASPQTPKRPESGGGEAGGGSETQPPPSAPPSQPQTPASPSGGGGTGGGTGTGTGGGSGTGSGTGTGTGSGTGSEPNCLGPIAQLPPICLPSLGGGGSGGGGGGGGLPLLP